MPTLQFIPIDQIHPRPSNLRQLVDGSDLVPSIKKFGILQPLALTANGDGYYVDAGHRRLDGARRAKLTEVPALISDGNTSDGDDLVESTKKMLVENLQRVDLSPLEEAKGYRDLVAEGVTQAQIAKDTGLSTSLISRRIKLLSLPAEILSYVTSGELTLQGAEDLVELAELDTPTLLQFITNKEDDYQTWLSDGEENSPEQLKELRADFVDELWPSEWELATMVKSARYEQATKKISTTLARAGVTFVDPDLVQPPWGSDVDVLKVFAGTDDTFYVWLLIFDDDGNPVVVGTKPLEIEAAMTMPNVDGLSIRRGIDGAPQLVAVCREPYVEHVPEAVAEDASEDDKARAREAAAEREAEKARKARKLVLAGQRHDKAEVERVVAGKVNKTDVTEWALRMYVETANANAKANAAKILQLDSVLSGTYKGAPKSYNIAFDQAWAAAEGVARTRMLLALVLGQEWGGITIKDEVKAALGVEKFDPTA